MIKFDHIAITVNNLEESIHFYKEIGYKLINQFHDDEYKWATLYLENTGLELFEILNKNQENIQHIAYSFESDEEAFNLATSLGYNIDELEIFYGDLNRKSFFINDKSKTSIQLIKRK